VNEGALAHWGMKNKKTNKHKQGKVTKYEKHQMQFKQNNWKKILQEKFEKKKKKFGLEA
jgi:hypothetical protein